MRQDDGRYLVDPDGAGVAEPFKVSDQDFNFRSLLGNAVIRWEWSPGSTIFLIWQQTRSVRISGSQFDAVGAQGVGDFDFRHDSAELFKLKPDNILLADGDPVVAEHMTKIREAVDSIPLVDRLRLALEHETGRTMAYSPCPGPPINPARVTCGPQHEDVT